MGRFRSAAAAAAVVILVPVMVVGPSPAPVSSAPVVEDEQFPVANEPGPGVLHMVMDDGVEVEYNDPPSMLTVNGASSGTPFCTSPSAGVCAGSDDLWFIANLPVCSATVVADCVKSMTATTAAGTTVNAAFDTQYPARGPLEYTGDPAKKVPTGASPGLWRLPGVEHAGGDRYLVVARLRGSTSNRAKASFQAFIVPVEIRQGVDTSPGYRLPTWDSPGRPGGGSTADLGTMRCALWGDAGSCALRRPFPAGVRFSLSVVLSVEPVGWLHGRLTDPTIGFDTEGANTLVTVSGGTVKVPAVQVHGQHTSFSQAIQSAYSSSGAYPNAGSRSPGGADLTDLTQRNAFYVIKAYEASGFDHFDNWKSAFNDTASYAPSYWRVRTLSDDELSGASRCITTGAGLKGLVTTDAMIYGSGPPALSADGRTLDYRIASPHFTRTGDVTTGHYSLAVRSDVAECLYGLADVSPVATASYAEEEAYVDSTYTDDGGLESQAAAGDLVDVEAPVVEETTTAELAAEETAASVENPTEEIAVTRASLTDQLSGGPNTTVTESNGWVYFGATDLTFSSPRVKVQMSRVPVRRILCAQGSTLLKVVSRGGTCPSGSQKVRTQNCVRRSVVRVAVGTAPRCPSGFAKAVTITCAKGSTARKAIAPVPRCPKGFTKVSTVHCVKGKAARVVTAVRASCGNGFARATLITCRKGGTRKTVLGRSPRCPAGFRRSPG